MATSSNHRWWIYDVFLSFRGADSRTFVEDLHSVLARQNMRTFLYDETLLGGGPLDSSITKAIQESRCAVIVFSTNYAGSTRCLREVTYIIKCMEERGLIFIPLYYHVDPLDVRGRYGEFGKQFYKRARENPTQLVNSWRKAISTASKIEFQKHQPIEWEASSKRIDQIADMISKSVSCKVEMKVLKFSLQNILLATNDFSEGNSIAHGGFGRVYIGRYKHYGLLAVKQLDRRRGQGDREFMNEIALLSAYNHENLVSLVGFCDEDNEKILVYKFEKNGSLDCALLRKNLTWIQRLYICLGVARGLKYLHDDVGVQHRVLHRDIKSANILLDENWKPKISDFGLSKIALANVPFTALYSNACGTYGYTDPQYIKRGILTQKSDVYSFGVVLLEVLFGKLVSVAEHPDEHHFSLKAAKDHYEKKTLDELIDLNLREKMDSKSLNTFSKIAFDCLKKRGEERPTTCKVMEELKKALDHQLAAAAT